MKANTIQGSKDARSDSNASLVSENHSPPGKPRVPHLESRNKEPNLAGVHKISRGGRCLPGLGAQEVRSRDQEHDAELMAPKNIQVLSPGSRIPVTVHRKRVFADVLSFRILRWEDKPRLPGWALNAVTRVLIKGTQRENLPREEKRPCDSLSRETLDMLSCGSEDSGGELGTRQPIEGGKGKDSPQQPLDGADTSVLAQ